MKKLIICSALMLAMCHTKDRKIKYLHIPEAVKTGLHRSFSATNVQWEREYENFEASFYQDGKSMSVVLDATGKILESEEEIKKQELPPAILLTLTNKYSDLEIEKVAKIDTEGIGTFEVELEQRNKIIELMFDLNGKLIGTQTKKEDNN